MNKVQEAWYIQSHKTKGLWVRCNNHDGPRFVIPFRENLPIPTRMSRSYKKALGVPLKPKKENPQQRLLGLSG